jgi:hypothetical protein
MMKGTNVILHVAVAEYVSLPFFILKADWEIEYSDLKRKDVI